MKKCTIAVATVLLLFACKNNKEEVLNDVCSTANVSYTSTIAPIVNANGCLNCHNSTAMQGGFSLQSYEQVKAKAMQTRSGNSVLYGAVAHSNGFSPMPQGMSKLNDCDISKIKAWVDNNMPQ
jgi:mono/diheme cytochrome c family protein